jgi:hypothetical protein
MKIVYTTARTVVPVHQSSIQSLHRRITLTHRAEWTSSTRAARGGRFVAAFFCRRRRRPASAATQTLDFRSIGGTIAVYFSFSADKMPSINNLGAEFPDIEVNTQLGTFKVHEVSTADTRHQHQSRPGSDFSPRLLFSRSLLQYLAGSWGILFSHPKDYTPGAFSDGVSRK